MKTQNKVKKCHATAPASGTRRTARTAKVVPAPTMPPTITTYALGDGLPVAYVEVAVAAPDGSPRTQRLWCERAPADHARWRVLGLDLQFHPAPHEPRLKPCLRTSLIAGILEAHAVALHGLWRAYSDPPSHSALSVRAFLRLLADYDLLPGNEEMTGPFIFHPTDDPPPGHGPRLSRLVRRLATEVLDDDTGRLQARISASQSGPLQDHLYADYEMMYPQFLEALCTAADCRAPLPIPVLRPRFSPAGCPGQSLPFSAPQPRDLEGLAACLCSLLERLAGPPVPRNPPQPPAAPAPPGPSILRLPPRRVDPPPRKRSAKAKPSPTPASKPQRAT
jgi:hypothetical protein